MPLTQLVGELNAGWTIAKYLLTHEREMIGAIGERSLPPPVGRFAVERIGRDAAGRLDDPVLRAEIARFEVDEAAFRAWIALVGEQARGGEAHPAMSSGLKYYGAELNKRRWELMMAAGGADALEWEGARSQEGAAARTWIRTKGNSIEGGTSEVQLNVVAKRMLGLPGRSEEIAMQFLQRLISAERPGKADASPQLRLRCTLFHAVFEVDSPTALWIAQNAARQRARPSHAAETRDR